MTENQNVNPDKALVQKSKGQRYDWLAIKNDWVGGIETLNQVRLRYDIDCNLFYKMVREQGWLEEKEKILAEAQKVFNKNLVERKVQEWKNQQILWESVESLAAKILKRAHENLRPDGSVNYSLEDSGYLAALTVAIQNALKAQMAIREQTTGQKTEFKADLNLAVRILNDEFQREGKRVPIVYDVDSEGRVIGKGAGTNDSGETG